MRKLFRLSYLLVLFALLLSACNLPTGVTTEPTASGDTVRTAAAQTVQALQTQIAETMPAPQDATQGATEAPPTTAPTSEAVINTPAPSLPTNTPFVVTLAPTSKPVPCDKASFVTDVNVPDGTKFDPGTSFTKTWRLKNDGTCTWSNAYKLVFVSGDAMGGPATVALPGNVNPGDSVDLSVNLKAPTSAKTYQGNWKLQNASGKNFGVGSNADQPFWVKIVVGSGTQVPDYFAVTGVVTTAKISGDTCSRTVTVKAQITVSKAGTVTYEWRRYDDSSSDKQSLAFDEAGTKTVSETLTIDATGGPVSAWDQIYVDNPNHQLFQKASFTVKCP